MRKKHFQKDIASNSLGSPPLRMLLEHLQPYIIVYDISKYWFSAHLHVKFAAEFAHEKSTTKYYFDYLSDRFLALDKCLPGRDFL
jgi:lariat debranching enzyme